MLRTLVLALLVASAFAAEKKAPAVTVPAGAVVVSPGVFRHTDSAGKRWIYRKTPFGFVKAADVPELDDKPLREGDTSSPFGPTKVAAKDSDALRVTERGEELRFERNTPFGVTKWTRKKTELNPAEQEAWDKSRATPGTR